MEGLEGGASQAAAALLPADQPQRSHDPQRPHGPQDPRDPPRDLEDLKDPQQDPQQELGRWHSSYSMHQSDVEDEWNDDDHQDEPLLSHGETH